MKLEKRRYEDVLILRFVGEFDSFNLPSFSEHIDQMIDGGDQRLILDCHLLKFINSAALGYLIKTRKRLTAQGGDMLLARPSKFVKKTLGTLGLDALFRIFDSVESALMHFKQGLDIGELDLEAGEQDESLTGSVPILFRPAGGDADEDAPNQVGRIVTLYEDGLLFRYTAEGPLAGDPVQAFLKSGADLKMKFRQPFAVKDHYFEMLGSVVEVSEQTDDDGSSLTARVHYGEISDDDRMHLQQFVRDQDAWRKELGQ
ncbi:MAG: STAS domain-containing protein [Planctomycetota bacterium]